MISLISFVHCYFDKVVLGNDGRRKYYMFSLLAQIFAVYSGKIGVSPPLCWTVFALKSAGYVKKYLWLRTIADSCYYMGGKNECSLY